MQHNRLKLSAHILQLSVSNDFEEACGEWKFVGAEILDKSCCPCGQTIKERCYLENKLNGNTTHVGNVCVNKFMGMDTSNLFAGLKRLLDNPDGNANQAVIDYAKDRGLIYSSEIKFLTDTKNKRKLSQAQMGWKRKINWRIINDVRVKE